MKVIAIFLFLTTIANISLAGGSSPSPSKILKVIPLDESLDYDVPLSVAYFQNAGINEALYHAINPNLTEHIDDHQKEIRQAAHDHLGSSEAKPPFSQISVLGFFNMTAIQLSRFDLDRLNNAVFDHLFSLNLPLNIRVDDLLRNISKGLEFRVSFESLDQLLQIVVSEKLPVQIQSRIEVRESAGRCRAALVTQFKIKNNLTVDSVPVRTAINLEKAPDIAQYCE